MNTHIYHSKECNKAQWNGLVHYSLQPMPFGYDWYLKSVLREWKMAILEDFQMGIVLPIEAMTPSQKELLPSFGLYTVSRPTLPRSQVFIESFKSQIPEPLPLHLPLILDDNHIKETGQTYRHIPYSAWGQDRDHKIFNYAFSHHTLSALVDQYHYTTVFNFESVIKDAHLPEDKKSTMYRIFYNAIHRGLGTVMMAKNLHTDQKAYAFLIQVPNATHEILHLTTDDNSSLALYATLIRMLHQRPIDLYIWDTKSQHAFHADYTKSIVALNYF